MLLQIILTIVQAVIAAVLPHLLGLIKKANPTVDRATARQWVKDMLTEMAASLDAKGVIPVWAKPFEPLLESALEQVLDTALDAAAL